MDKPLRFIQVGIGGMGQTWLRAVQASDEAAYAGFVEVNPDIARQVAEQFNLDTSLIFPTLTDALDAVQADGVIDVTPPRFHMDISTQALKAGLPVLSEKPLGDTLDSAQAIVNTANETDVLHMVAQNYRYSVPSQTVKQVFDSGVVGKPQAVTVEFFKGPHFGGFREEMPYPLIIDMAIHHFDMMRFFLGSNPVSVYGRSWNPSWSWYSGDASASISIQFQSGAVVAYNGSWCSPGRETSWNGNWRFECESGVVTLVDDVVQVQRMTGVDGFQTLHSEVETVAPPSLERTAQAYLLHEFCEAIRTGSTPMTTCQDNIHSLAMVFDAVKSFETNQVVTNTL